MMKLNSKECQTHGCCNPANSSGYCAICEAQQKLHAAHYADEDTARVELPPVNLHPEPELTGMVLLRSWWNFQTRELTQVWGFAESEKGS